MAVSERTSACATEWVGSWRGNVRGIFIFETSLFFEGNPRTEEHREPHSFARGTMARHDVASVLGDERDGRGLSEDREVSSDDADGLGPFFGALPQEVLKEVLLPKLSALSRALFARASTACMRAVEEAQLSWRLHPEACVEAVICGHLECLRYAHENRCPWNEWTCISAAMHGHLECLRYARDNGCPCPKECRNL